MTALSCVLVEAIMLVSYLAIYSTPCHQQVFFGLEATYEHINVPHDFLPLVKFIFNIPIFLPRISFTVISDLFKSK